MEVTATVPKLGDLEVSAEVNLGADLDEAVAIHGKDIVYSAYIASAVIKAQSYMRSKAVAGKTPEEIKTEMAEWKLGQMRVTGEAGLSGLLKKFDKLPEDKKKELIAKLLASSSEE
jgi:hypothetical protein